MAEAPKPYEVPEDGKYRPCVVKYELTMYGGGGSKSKEVPGYYDHSGQSGEARTVIVEESDFPLTFTVGNKEP